ncbi:SAF domain-containing protein [Nonomuraea rosea]|uniref:SAF domain-containing protein n=1 Tax=Nonomuraea rosea TaxID=638574 RepID=A0ABP6X4Y2_9ACTN
MSTDHASRGTGASNEDPKNLRSSFTEAALRMLPVPARKRRPGLAALAVLLILGGSLATTVLVINADKRVSAIMVTQQIGAGRPFRPEMIREARVVEDGVRYELWANRAQVSQALAAVTLLPGTVVTTDMTVEQHQELGPGKARVGLALKPGQLPSEMQPGQRVQIVLVPSSNSAAGLQTRLLAENALVTSVGLSRNRASDEVTVIVDSAIAPEIAAYSSAGQIAITELPGSR